jgi:23S rRNA-/tRNA-specific pseudouridylate synthase
MTQKYADDGFSRTLGDLLDRRIAALQNVLDAGSAISRDELVEFIWKIGQKSRQLIQPGKGKLRDEAWMNAKGMLKGIINFEKFSAIKLEPSCIANVLEKEVLDCITRYRTFLLTGEVTTNHPPPKLLGETDEIVCVDKPCRYVCQFGADQVPRLSGLPSASALLNQERPEIQLHEYLALKYDYETAIKTREWWTENATEIPCERKLANVANGLSVGPPCGKCKLCAATQTGCCNRLDKETSGVTIAAKTLAGFPVIREQFASEAEHSLEKGGTEKHYLALVHGHVDIPTQEDVRHPEHWVHGLETDPKDTPRGRIAITTVWDAGPGRGLAVCYESGRGQSQHWDSEHIKGLWAITLYEPVAWLRHNSTGQELSLIKLQIVSGRRHQIRFHCSEIGHNLVGDPRYDPKCEDDRTWCPRVFLHSYCTKFREPFTERWYEATSPLPQDLGEVIEKNCSLIEVRERLPVKLQSRRHHESLKAFMEQYDPKKRPLLYTAELDKDARKTALAKATDLPDVEQRRVAKAAEFREKALANAADSNFWMAAAVPKGAPPTKKRRIIVPAEFAAMTPVTPPLKRTPKQPSLPPPVVQQPVINQVPSLPPPVVQQPVQQAQFAAQVGVPGQTGAVALRQWIRMESRSQPGVFYYWNEQTGQTNPEPPPPWELKQSRSQPGVFYYWNTATGATSVVKPEI